MSNTSLDLSNKLPADQIDIIRQVVHAAESQRLRLFIVGAQARDLLLQYVYDLPVHRATNDIDFGIVVQSWDEFSRLRDVLIASKIFQAHRTMRQRLVHESGLLIDLVPFTTFGTLPPRGWQTAEQMRSHWLKSSDGQTFEWLCVTRTQRMSRSVEPLKIWSNPLDQVTNR